MGEYTEAEMLDAMQELRSELCAELGWSEHRVRRVLIRVRERGLMKRAARGVMFRYNLAIVERLRDA